MVCEGEEGLVAKVLGLRETGLRGLEDLSKLGDRGDSWGKGLAKVSGLGGLRAERSAVKD